MSSLSTLFQYLLVRSLAAWKTLRGREVFHQSVKGNRGLWTFDPIKKTFRCHSLQPIEKVIVHRKSVESLTCWHRFLEFFKETTSSSFPFDLLLFFLPDFFLSFSGESSNIPSTNSTSFSPLSLW